MERRLAAILAADVVGYTALMGADEAGTLRRLIHLREEFLEPLIDAHRGRIVKLMGDGLLVEFSSVVDAVACALAWQGHVIERESATEKNKQLRFRIGINVGDVIVENSDIHGDGVNIAARLEAMAEPGGIYLSDDAYRQVRGKTEASFDDMGARPVKNLAEPLRVFRVAPGTAERTTPESLPEKPFDIDFALPDYPSIAVLPFTVMSADPEQEFFSDGIAEDIITALSKVSGLLVVARNSTFTYKGRAVDTKQVSREQGVRYVLEGSVRKAGRRVRVTAQLIDAKSAMHLWAERYDRDLEDIFAVQDEITREVVTALDVRLTGGEQARMWSSGTQNLEAWSCVRQGMDLTNRATPESVREARQLCKKALDLDPHYPMAWVVLGWVHHHSVDVSVKPTYDDFPGAEVDAALNCAAKALELDPTCADAYSLAGFCNLSRGEYDTAIAMSAKAVELAPGNAEILGLAAMSLLKSGQPAEALEFIKRAIRHCPVFPIWFCSVLATAHRLLGSTDAAITIFEAAISRDADFIPLHVGLASILGELGREAEAQKPLSEILRLSPGFSIRSYMAGLSYRDPSVRARFEEGLRKAGLPA